MSSKESADDYEGDKHSIFELGGVNILGSSSLSMDYEAVSSQPRVQSQKRVSKASYVVKSKFEIEFSNDAPVSTLGKIKKSLTQFKGLIFGLLAAFLLSLSNVILRKTKSFSGSDHALVRYTISFVFLLVHIRRNNIQLFPKNNLKILFFRGFIG
jgi:hypothetical protein